MGGDGKGTHDKGRNVGAALINSNPKHPKP